ncbi:MAG: hypothetical protein Q7S19_01380 [bacterium]|nr:hypothetical protein [bacterium]
MIAHKHTNNLFLVDLAIFILSIAAAAFLVKTGILVKVLTSTNELGWVGSFITGMFFTSVFTTAPAIVTLGAIASAGSVISTALFGSMGAVIGDMIIFNFFHDSFSPHLMEFINYKGLVKRAKFMVRSRFFRWLPVLVGGLIIASPLPDEMGIALMSFSKVKPRSFVLLSFAFNFIGILLIGLVAKTI